MVYHKHLSLVIEPQEPKLQTILIGKESDTLADGFSIYFPLHTSILAEYGSLFVTGPGFILELEAELGRAFGSTCR